MTNATHTPGSWRALTPKGSIQKCQVIHDSSEYPNGMFGVAHVWGNTHDEAIANTRLIAAAPDFYEGCRGLPQITDGESTADYDKRVLAWFYLNAHTIYRAVKKAEGK